MLLPARSAQIWSKSARLKSVAIAIHTRDATERKATEAFAFFSFLLYCVPTYHFRLVLLVIGRRTETNWQVSFVRAALIIKTVTSRTHLIKISEGTGLLQRRRNILHTAPFFLSFAESANENNIWLECVQVNESWMKRRRARHALRINNCHRSFFF